MITVDQARLPNWAHFVPKLARVDVIQGKVTGPVTDRDASTAPDTKVVKAFEVGGQPGKVHFVYRIGALDGPLYLRVRGTDGNRQAVGLRGAAVDPHGPAMDVPHDADPWRDLWFYTNPIWAVPV
ncbi:hypothetical protein [Crossiella sp. CA198]|uniref:hypothetical protein n=1 Tax=Crossiella sp. CA198 TaxID=3455607 RepID=UPI003F8D61B9